MCLKSGVCFILTAQLNPDHISSHISSAQDGPVACGHCIGRCSPGCADSARESKETCTIFHLFKQCAPLNVTFSQKVSMPACPAF